ncbi:MAG: ABC transporter permease subunit [Chitinophagaceae bacterium]
MSKLLSAVWQMEWLQLRRSRMVQIMWLFLFFTAGYALMYGYGSVQKQQGNQMLLDHLNDSTRNVYLSYFRDPKLADSVRFGYDGMNSLYDGFTVEDFLQQNMAIDRPGRLTHLAIGQRDVYPPYRKVSARSLYYDGSGISLGDKYTETNNPHKQLAGNFDLAFWLIYLVPLFIIARCYGVYSEDKENGTMLLLQQMPVSVRTIIAYRLSFRLAGVLLLVFLVSVIGYFWSPVKMTTDPDALWQWLLVSVSYILFWFALCWLMVSLRLSSAVTALSLTGAWILFLFIIPGLVNNYISTKYPLSSRTALVNALNERTAALWDEPDTAHQAVLYREYPTLAPPSIQPLWTATDSYDSLGKSEAVDKRYNKKLMLWHYTLDRSIRKQVRAYEQQLETKEKAAHDFAWIHPAMAAQRGLTLAAASGEDHQALFRKATEEYRDSIFRMTVSNVFLDRKMTRDDYLRYGKFDMQQTKTTNDPSTLGVVVLLVYILIFIACGYGLFKRRI